jgi:hypothetical protein
MGSNSFEGLGHGGLTVSQNAVRGKHENKGVQPWRVGCFPPCQEGSKTKVFPFPLRFAMCVCLFLLCEPFIEVVVLECVLLCYCKLVSPAQNFFAFNISRTNRSLV